MVDVGEPRLVRKKMALKSATPMLGRRAYRLPALYMSVLSYLSVVGWMWVLPASTESRVAFFFVLKHE